MYRRNPPLPSSLETLRRGNERNITMRFKKIDILYSINSEFALKWDVDVLVNNASVGQAGPY
jgi:short-subunit dehydrogenase